MPTSRWRIFGPGGKPRVGKDDGPVCDVRLPVNDPFTGRYALFNPPASERFPSGRVPNTEDAILVARTDSGFRPVLAVHVPWDEAPLQLWDSPESPELVVVYHRYYPAFSRDSGRTFRRPTQEQEQAIGYQRWGSIGILEAYIQGEREYLRTWTLDPQKSYELVPGWITVRTWSLDLWNDPTSLTPEDDTVDSSEDPDIVAVTEEARRVVEDLREQLVGTRGEEGARRTVQFYMIRCGVDQALSGLRPPRPPDPKALLETDGEYLYARKSPKEPQEPVPLIRLLVEHAGKFPLDFFGGAGARTLLR